MFRGYRMTSMGYSRPFEHNYAFECDNRGKRSVTVALDRQTLAAFGREFPLGPDMTLRADIVLDRRSLLAWLFEPLLGLRGRWS